MPQGIAFPWKEDRGTAASGNGHAVSAARNVAQGPRPPGSALS
jgi:hypothetical protein